MSYVVASAVGCWTCETILRKSCHGSKTYASEGASDDGTSVKTSQTRTMQEYPQCCCTAEQSL